MKTSKIRSVLFLSLILFVVFSASAETYLSASKIKELISGNTIDAEHLKKGFSFKVFFDKDGKTAIRNQKGNSKTISYKYEGDKDKHCIHWAGKDRCAKILDNGDGTYTRINPKGKKIVKWTKINKGKTL